MYDKKILINLASQRFFKHLILQQQKKEPYGAVFSSV